MGLYPVPPSMQDNRLKEGEQGQSPSDKLLEDFISALQQPPQVTLQEPKPLSINDRIYLALKGARDPEFRKRVVDPLIAERANYPAARAQEQEALRQQRIKELGNAVTTASLTDLRGAQAAAVPETTAAKTLAAQAAMERAKAAFKKGGKPYTIPNVVIPDGYLGAGGPGIEFGITDPDTGERHVMGYRRANIRGVVITDEKGTQTLENPYMNQPGQPTQGSPGGKSLDQPGPPGPGGTAAVPAPAGPGRLQTGGISKQPGPGIQQAVAQSVSTIDGFAELKGAYTRIRQSGSTYGRMGREYVGNMFPRIQEAEDPEMAIFIATRRAALNRYIKAVTGAQFSIAELTRYEAQLPGAGADDAVADTKIRLLAQQSIATLRTLVAENGGLEAIIRDPQLQKQLDLFIVNPAQARKALGLGASTGDMTTDAASTPPGITPGSTYAGRSKSTGRRLWRSPKINPATGLGYLEQE